ncbi:MAG TPA: UvrD-helicase domain-containing protein, partial [Anaeromyxobacteraceae bacterium]|nr:UvrD-helicase domain-containing protein [Anaeromyxobacteraceae bacterium]
IVSASAGTGKTRRLSQDLARALLDGRARPEGVVAVTYTLKAAGELASRIRGALLEEARPDLAARVRDGYLGTLHAVCQRLLREFALEAGLSPYLEPVPDSERQHLFDRALSQVVAGREAHLNRLARRLSMDDWKQTLRRIVDRARENGMGATELRRSATASRTTLDALLPPVAVRADDWHDRLRAELARLSAALRTEVEGDPGNGAARERARLASALSAEQRTRGAPPFKELVRLAGLVDKKKLASIAGGFVELVRSHLESEPFQADLRAVQADLFALAAQAIDTFAAEKAAARVLDFGDMLAFAHDLLARPSVVEALRERLDLVVVDEFQDISPLQLALATALARIARHSIWVGDRKQAIFAFQGSDPELMSAAVDRVLGGKAPDILGTSYRSRPPLVDLVSELFTRALRPFGFPEEQVRLVAARPDPGPLVGQPAFEAWRWRAAPRERGAEGGVPREAHAIAEGVEALLAAGLTVRDRGADGGDRLRPAGRRDIAVLAFRNERCREIAAALQARGIPATAPLAGLARQPEFLLARAALALLADRADGIAALEVSWLSGRAASDPDGWLSRRLLEIAAWREAQQLAEAAGERGPPRPWPFEDDPRVAALRAAEAAHLSPAEGLDLALRLAGVPALLRSWPEPERRLANLEAVRAEARGYENLCQSRRAAATVLGLVAHLGELDLAAEQATPTAADAVQVTTWHGAKGLEWPVVILSELDFARAPEPFEIAVEPAQTFDFNAPLAGRWIRYWPWPYAQLSKDLPLLESARRAPEALRADARARAERTRLLYVGFTRARDLLVAVAGLPARGGPAVQVLSALDDGARPALLAWPFEARGELDEVRVGRRTWACRVRTLSGLPSQVERDAPASVRWFAAGSRQERPPERLVPSSEPRGAEGRAEIVAVTSLGPRRALLARPEEMATVGDAVHAFLAADAGEDPQERRAMAARLLAAHGVESALDPTALLEISTALRTFLEARHPGAVWRREWPVRARLGGRIPRLLVGEVDLLLELPDAFVVVDHKTFPGSEVERDRRLEEAWAPQLGWYAEALRRALKKPLLAAYVHLPVRNEVIEVRMEGASGSSEGGGGPRGSRRPAD